MHPRHIEVATDHSEQGDGRDGDDLEAYTSRCYHWSDPERPSRRKQRTRRNVWLSIQSVGPETNRSSSRNPRAETRLKATLKNAAGAFEPDRNRVGL
jgi:hypothetical protein